MRPTFRLLRPLHGWRAFLGEVGVVLLGVLLALAAQQLLETINWNRQVRDSRQALGFEIADSIGEGYEREALSPCIERRLDEIAAILMQAGKSGRLPPVGKISGPPYRTWLSNVWQTTMAGQTASHFSRFELSQYGNIYQFVSKTGEASSDELRAWNDLQSIVGPGRPTSAEEIAFLLRQVEQARGDNMLIGVSSIRLRQVADQADIPYDRATVASYTDGSLPRRSICAPIGPPVQQYGLSPYSGLSGVKQRPIVVR